MAWEPIMPVIIYWAGAGGRGGEGGKGEEGEEEFCVPDPL